MRCLAAIDALGRLGFLRPNWELDIPAVEKDRIFGGNARALFGL